MPKAHELENRAWPPRARLANLLRPLSSSRDGRAQHQRPQPSPASPDAALGPALTSAAPPWCEQRTGFSVGRRPGVGFISLAIIPGEGGCRGAQSPPPRHPSRPRERPQGRDRPSFAFLQNQAALRWWRACPGPRGALGPLPPTSSS